MPLNLCNAQNLIHTQFNQLKTVAHPHSWEGTMKEKGWTTVCSIAQQEEIGECWTFSKIICSNIVSGRNLFPILILFFSGKKEETMAATEASWYEVKKAS